MKRIDYNTHFILIQESNKMSDREEFDLYRKNHPGPESDNSLAFWLKNGKKDRADFKWRAKNGQESGG